MYNIFDFELRKLQYTMFLICYDFDFLLKVSILVLEYKNSVFNMFFYRLKMIVEMKWLEINGVKFDMKGKKEFSYKMESYCCRNML